MTDSARLRIDATFRHEAGRLVGALTRLLGDFDIAEEAVQDALVEAVARWPAEGVPERPAAWLQRTARNRAIDRLRREARGAIRPASSRRRRRPRPGRGRAAR
jgi:RNA polymerase sigma-70 factor (ECF subfamily)